MKGRERTSSDETSMVAAFLVVFFTAAFLGAGLSEEAVCRVELLVERVVEVEGSPSSALLRYRIAQMKRREVSSLTHVLSEAW
jgi:hypothetical protein